MIPPDKQPTVSVCMIAYNHEDFLEQAIEGVLMQQANFSIELVIGEDRSPDRSREICIAYRDQHPEVIRLLDRDRNLGMQQNFKETIQACKGEYVAICEGDDYWTDPHKLQKQVDFLRANPEFSVCHHRLRITDADGQKFFAKTPGAPRVTTFEDLAKRQHIETASSIFRNGLWEFPDFFTTVHGTDYALHLLNSFHGKIRFSDEAMGVYRVHSMGEWSGRGTVDRTERALDTIRKCREYFYPRASKEFDFHILKTECFLNFEKREYAIFRQQVRMLFGTYRDCLNAREFTGLATRYFVSRLSYVAKVFDIFRAKLRD
jgi:glycosyltransferase involved in cell wall biosynthesis